MSCAADAWAIFEQGLSAKRQESTNFRDKPICFMERS